MSEKNYYRMAPKPPPPPPPDEEDDDLPTDSDDEEKQSPRRAPGDASEAPNVPLLKDLPKASDAPMSPRDKMIAKSKSSKPATPREGAEAPAAAAPAAATAAAVDPSQVAESAKAGAMQAAAELGNARMLTAEEASKAKEAAKAQATAAMETGKKLLEDIQADLPPPISMDKLPESKRMEKYIDDLAAAAEGQAGTSAVAKALKPCLVTTIRLSLAIQPWLTFVTKWVGRVWDLLPKNLVSMLFGAALCYFGGTYTASIAAV